MQDILRKTFGGLSTRYYVRHLFFGALFAALMISGIINGNKPVQASVIAFIAINTFLYPYSRFVYENVIGFVIGNNAIFVGALLMIIVKTITMMLCWSFAIFIAPIGLAYLYYHHSKPAS